MRLSPQHETPPVPVTMHMKFSPPLMQRAPDVPGIVMTGTPVPGGSMPQVTVPSEASTHTVELVRLRPKGSLALR
jgi:hypothetical protein